MFDTIDKKTQIYIAVVLLALSSVSTYISGFGNTTIWIFIHVLILRVFYRASATFYTRGQQKRMLVVVLFLLWNLICIIRGFFIAESYWGFKGLIMNSFGVLLPVVTFFSTNKTLVQGVLSFYLKFGFPLFIILIAFVPTDAYGFFLVPFSLLLLYIPVIKYKWQIIIVSVAIFVMVIDLGARSNIIKFFVPLLFLIIYWLKDNFLMKGLSIISSMLLLFPILMFVLAVFGDFNIFKIDKYFEGEHTTMRVNSSGEVEEADLAADTRTFLYVDVLKTAVKYNSWIIGRSPARGNESDAFGKDDMSGRNERLKNEVAILNVFTWTGTVGVVLYFLVFWKASSLAINHSNNIFSKMLGVFVAFRWAYAWVEDINSFNLNYFLLWMMIGMCFSTSFRDMSDFEMKLWIRSIFETKYRYLFLNFHKIRRKKQSYN